MKNIYAFCLLIVLTNQDLVSQNLVWQQTSSNNAEALAVNGNTIYAVGGNGLHFSNNKGATWNQLLTMSAGDFLKTIALHGSDIYVGGSISSAGAILKSVDFGQTWTNITPPGITEDVRSILITGTDIYIGIRSPIQPQGIFKSSLASLSSSSWSLFNTGLGNTSVMSLVASGSNILAGTEGKGVWISPASAANWTYALGAVSSLQNYVPVVNMSVNSSTVFACVHNSTPNLFKSVDNGNTWSIVNSSVFSAGFLYGIYMDGTNVYAGFELGGGPVFSTDQGATWAVKGNGLVTNQDKNIDAFAFVGQTLFAAAMSGVWKYDVVTETSVAEKAVAGNIDVYPNPIMNGILHVLNGQSTDSKITIVNGMGQIVLEQNATATQTNLDLTGHSKGLYTVIVSSGGTITTYKVMNE